MKYKKKIFIIGAGIFGCTIYIKLKNLFDCTLIEQSNDILNGASTNNLNRVHMGYHYPRDDQTAKQSYIGKKSFCKLYKRSIINKFPNYYLIANKSKVNYNNYINFLKRNKLRKKKININNFSLKTKNIEGIIKVNEPIYDWRIIKKDIKNKINIKENKIYFNTKIIKIKKIKKGYKIFSNNKIFYADVVIDSSYWSTNSIYEHKNCKRFKYQLTCIFQIKLIDFKKIGIAVMDGDFFSLLPNGKLKNNHLLYDVKYSVLKSKVKKKFNENWLTDKSFLNKIKKNKIKIKKKIQNFLPKINIKFLKKIHISPRVILPNVEKTDQRISRIIKIDKNYFQIFSAKVDHSVNVANTIKKIISKSN
jgi:hypothetical protein